MIAQTSSRGVERSINNNKNKRTTRETGIRTFLEMKSDLH